MTKDLTRDDLLALLSWQLAMGVDAVVGEESIDWLAREPASPGHGYDWPDAPQRAPLPPEAAPGAGNAAVVESRATGPGAPAAPSIANRSLARPQTPLAASAAETDARRAARDAQSLVQLEAALRAFDGCGLKATATNLCFYRGAARARVMFVGEAPGREEDIEGKPFVGRAGQLLDRMLAAIGLSEANVHITNIVYWRPPGNRTPTPQEALACRPFLERQMELVAPDIVVALGGAAAKEVLGVTDGIMKLRGKWRTVAAGERQVRGLATLHPAYLLRTPAAKQLAWADLLAIRSALEAG